MFKISEIGGVHDSADEGKMATYFGIGRQLTNSNATKQSSRMTECRAKISQTALVQCFLIARLYSPSLKKAYENSESTQVTGKAVIVVARKLLRIIFWMLKNAGEELGVRGFSPFCYGRGLLK